MTPPLPVSVLTLRACLLQASIKCEKGERDQASNGRLEGEVPIAMPALAAHKSNRVLKLSLGQFMSSQRPHCVVPS